jgi:hypothetical protein
MQSAGQKVKSMLLASLIASVRHQLKALDETLNLLEAEIEKGKPESQDYDREPHCPLCNCKELNDISTMGNPGIIACRNCDYQGKAA